MSSSEKRVMLYNKYRPQIFDDVMGQEHINDVLKGLIKTKNYRILNSLIFVGTAGGGKTTSARIFAKAVNCTSPLEDGNPCCECEHCKLFQKNGYHDFIEIDGATYNTVDSARNLVNLASTSPIYHTYYRCILIDEAHRLSNAAWDVFLKILEEGQNNTIFLFATTEPDKIRPAIKSRSFVFGIKPLTSAQIEKLLIKVCKAEGIKYDMPSIKTIAHYNKGKTRDSLKTVDMYYLSRNSLTGITMEVPETAIVNALVLSVLGNVDEAYNRLDLLLGQELDIRESVSKILIDIWQYPNSNSSGVSLDELEKAHTLFSPIIKAVSTDFMTYPFSDIESFKLFLLMVAEKALGTGKTVNQGESKTRRFRNVSPTSSEKDKEVVEVKKPEPTERVSKMEELLSKVGFELV